MTRDSAVTMTRSRDRPSARASARRSFVKPSDVRVSREDPVDDLVDPGVGFIDDLSIAEKVRTRGSESSDRELDITVEADPWSRAIQQRTAVRGDGWRHDGPETKT